MTNLFIKARREFYTPIKTQNNSIYHVKSICSQIENPTLKNSIKHFLIDFGIFLKAAFLNFWDFME